MGGRGGLSHKGGTHVNAVQKVLHSYEHIDPALIGNTRHVLISDLAGRSNIVMKARASRLVDTCSTTTPRDMLACIKNLEHHGYEFEAADGSLALLIRQALATRVHPFVVEAYHVSLRREAETSSMRSHGQGARRQGAGARSPTATGP